jgi:beta-N-acetylhexosaminidase
VARLSEIKATAGQLIVGGFAGDSLPEGFKKRLTAGHLGGVILFRRNLRDLHQIAALNREIQSLRVPHTPPLLISTDQEGGRVSRLRGMVTDLPPMADFGEKGDRELTRKIGQMVGEELSALGINVNFAPVMDVHTEPSNPVIGDRSFSSDVAVVSQLGVAFADGLSVRGVVPCAKHFPGHGDTIVDSHLDLPSIQHSVERLEAVELQPFKYAVSQGITMIMIGHLLVDAMDRLNPSSLSPDIITGLLRRQFRFEGVIISDCLEMAAVADRFSASEIAIKGVESGLDLLLFSHSEDRQEIAREALIRVAEKRPSLGEQIIRSGQRVMSLRKEMLVIEPAMLKDRFQLIGCNDHQKMVSKLSE